MRAWLLLLAVLATSKPIVQVASTEDLTTRFSTAISTRSVTSLTASYEPVFEEQPLVSSSRTVVLYDSDKSESDSNKSTDSDENSLIVIHKSEETQGPVNEEFRPEEQAIEVSSRDSNQLESLEQEQKTKKLFDKLENNNYSEHVVTKREASSESSEKSSSKLSDQTANDLESFESDSLEAASSSKSSSSSGVSESLAAIEEEEKEEEEEEEQISVMAFDSNEDTSDMESSPSLPSSSLDSSHIQHSSDKRTTSHSNSATDDVTVSEVMQEEGEGEEEHDTYSNKEVIGDKLKPDPSTLVEIENSLLSLFNMKRPPKIDRSKIIIPEAMKQLYAQIMGHEIDSVNIPKPGLLTKSANTVRSFTHQESKIDDRFLNHHRFRLHFDVKSIPTDEKLKAAEVQLSRDAISHAVLHPRLANRTRYQVLVYDITRVGIRGKREPTYLLLDNKTIRLNSTDTISLDVQPAVDRWLETPKKNYGLLIEVRTFRALKPAPHHHVRLRRSADEPHEQWQHKQPLLFTYTDDGRHKSRSIRDINSRPKRAGHHRRPHRRKNNVEICRRQSLYVDFTDVGWSDWIVAPPGYDAYYCHGKCPFPLAEHLNSTNHAVVQTLVNNLNPGKVPNACCVPTQLTGISMLYLNDQSTVVLKNYQDMTVVGCGCR